MADGNAGVLHRLEASGDGIDMAVSPETVSSRTVYTGAVFHVDDRRIRLSRSDGGSVTIRRQVVCNRPCVVMLVHDEPRDRYLLEREYRAGSAHYAFGIPAGLINRGEDARHAALRELREETGVAPDRPDDVRVDHVGDCYSSEGMSDELAHIVVIHLKDWHAVPRHFDPDEHVESTWVPWARITTIGIVSSNAVIAIQHESLRRLNALLDAFSPEESPNRHHTVRR